MSKKKKPKQKQQPSKLERQGEKVLRLAHEILIKKISPANLSLEEAIDALAFVVKAIVISNTSDDDPADRAEMIEWIEERFVEILRDVNPCADHPHAWLISPQGNITEPCAIAWSGAHEAMDSVKVVLGADLESFTAEVRAAGDVHVTEGVDGLAMIDPEWDGSPTVTCANPECGKTHDVHLRIAEHLFEDAKRHQTEKGASN